MERLTHDEKYVLKVITKVSKEKDTCHFKSDQDIYPLVSDKFTRNELLSILDSLYSKGYFDPEHYGTAAPGRIFVIKHDAAHYTELRAKEVLHTLVTSVFIPIIVAIATALITTYFTISGK